MRNTTTTALSAASRSIKSLLLVLTLVAGMLLGIARPAYASIAGPTDFDLNLTWEITDDGELIIQPKNPNTRAAITRHSPGEYETANPPKTREDGKATWPWNSYRNQITKVTISAQTSAGKPAVETYNNQRLAYMFADMPNLTSVDTTGLVTTRVEDVRGMFENCTSLTELDLSNWVNNGSMKYMQDLCAGCTSLEKFTLNNPDFHTRVTTQAANAGDYSSYTLYDGRNNGMVTYNVGTAANGAQTQRMFGSNKDPYNSLCTSLKEIDMSNVTISIWNPSQESTFIDSIKMLGENGTLKKLNLSNIKLPATSAGKVAEMTSGNQTIEELYFDIREGDIDDAINTQAGLEELVDKLLERCTGLKVVDLSGWETSDLPKKDDGSYTVFDFKNLREEGALERLIALDSSIRMVTKDPDDTGETISPDDISSEAKVSDINSLNLDWNFSNDFTTIGEGDEVAYDLTSNIDAAAVLHAIISGTNGKGNLASGDYTWEATSNSTLPFADENGNSRVPKTYYLVNNMDNSYPVLYGKGPGDTQYKMLYTETTFGPYVIQSYDGESGYRIYTQEYNMTQWDEIQQNGGMLDSTYKLKLVYPNAAVDVNGKYHDVVVDINSVTFMNMDKIPNLKMENGEYVYKLDPYGVNPWGEDQSYTDDDGVTHAFNRNDQYRLVGTVGGVYDENATYTRQLITTFNGTGGCELNFWNQIYSNTDISSREELLSKGSGTYINYDITIDDALPDTSVLFWVGDLDVAREQVWNMDDADSGKDRMESNAYGPGSEGIVLGEGNDLNTLTLANKTGLEVYDGNTIVGTASDPDTSWSRFYVRANAQGANYTWTSGISCKTAILRNTEYDHELLPEVFVIPEAFKTVNGTAPAGEYKDAFTFTIEKATEIGEVPYEYFYMEENNGEDGQQQTETRQLPNSLESTYRETMANDGINIPLPVMKYDTPRSTSDIQHSINEHEAKAYVYRITENIPVGAKDGVMTYNTEKVVYYMAVIVSDPKTDIEMYKGTRADVRLATLTYTGETPQYADGYNDTRLDWVDAKTVWSQDAVWAELRDSANGALGGKYPIDGQYQERTPDGTLVYWDIYRGNWVYQGADGYWYFMTGTRAYNDGNLNDPVMQDSSSLYGRNVYTDTNGVLYYFDNGMTFRYIDRSNYQIPYTPVGKKAPNGSYVLEDASGKEFFRDGGEYLSYPDGDAQDIAKYEQEDRTVEYDADGNGQIDPDTEVFTIYVDKNGVEYIKTDDGQGATVYRDPETFAPLTQVTPNTVFPSADDTVSSQKKQVEGTDVRMDVHGNAYIPSGEGYLEVELADQGGTAVDTIDVEDGVFNPNAASDRYVYETEMGSKDGQSYPVKIDALGTKYIEVSSDYYSPDGATKLTVGSTTDVAPSENDKAVTNDLSDGQDLIINGHTIYQSTSDTPPVKYYKDGDTYYSVLGTILHQGTTFHPGDDPAATSSYDIRQYEDENGAVHLFYKGEGSYKADGSYETKYYELQKNEDGSYSIVSTTPIDLPAGLLDTSEAVNVGSFNNMVKTSEIVIGKQTVDGKAGEFTFQIAFDNDFVPANVAFEPPTVLSETADDGTVTPLQFIPVGNNTYKFTLTEGQQVTIKDVPLQTTYTITEPVEANGWELVSVDGDESAVSASKKITQERYLENGTVNPQWNYSHTFTNRFTELVVNKVRLGGDKNDEFNFTATATITGYRPNAEITYGLMQEDESFAFKKTKTDAQGNATIALDDFTLKGNHSENEGADDIVLVLPKGASVVISEKPAEGFITQWRLDDGAVKTTGSRGETDAIAMDKDQQRVTFYNMSIMGTAGIDFTKYLDGRSYIEGDEFTFMLTAEDGTPMPVKFNTSTGEFEPEATTADADIESAEDTVSANAGFKTLKYTLADLDPVTVTYKDATPAQRDAVLSWSAYDEIPTTEVDTPEHWTYGDAEYSTEQKAIDAAIADGVSETEAAAAVVHHPTTYKTEKVPSEDSTGIVYEKTFIYTIEENPRDAAAGDSTAVTNDSRRPQVKLYVMADPNAKNAAGETVGAIYISAADADGDGSAFVTNAKDADATLNYRQIDEAGTMAWVDNDGNQQEFGPKVIAEEVYFTNEYDAQATWTPDIVKVLNGRPLERDQFKFTIKANGALDEDGNAETVAQVKVQTEKDFPVPGNGSAESVEAKRQDVEKAAAGAETKGTNDLIGPVTFDPTVFTNEDLKKVVSYSAATNEQKLKVIYWESADGTVMYGPIPDDAQATVNVDGQTNTVSYASATDAQRKAAKGTTSASLWTKDGKTYIDNAELIPGDAKGTYYMASRTFIYKVWETGNGVTESDPGYAFDDAKAEATAKTIEVTVEEQFDGTLKVTAAPTNTTQFTNAYTAEGSFTLAATKVLEGRTLQAGEFSFTLSAPAGTPMPEKITVTNAADGTIDFGTIELTEASLMSGTGYDANRNKDGLYEKTFVYTITETSTSGDGVTVDPQSTRTVAVTVRENNAGKIEVVAVNGVAQNGSAVNAGTFTNEYAASGSVTITATKKLEGRSNLTANMFYFELSHPANTDHKVLDEKGNAAPASTTAKTATVTFSTITYNLDQVKADEAAGLCQRVDAKPGTPAEYEPNNPIGGFEAGVTYYTRSGEEGDYTYTEVAAGATFNADTDYYTMTKAAVPAEPEKWVYTYEIKELVPTGDAKADGIEYDTSVKTVTVEVSDNGEGALDVVAKQGDKKIADNPVVFINKSNAIDIKVTKAWADSALKDLAGYDRPVSVGVILKANGTEVDRTTLNGTTWTYTFKDLPKYTYSGTTATGITYTIEEVTPEGYKATYAVKMPDASEATPAADGATAATVKAGDITEANEATAAEVTITNTPKTAEVLGADFVVLKLDKSTGLPMQNVSFKLEKKAANDDTYTTVATKTTNVSGLATFSFTEAGTYRLTETVPTGYTAVGDNPRTLTVTKDATTGNYHVQLNRSSLSWQTFIDLLVGTTTGYDSTTKTLTVENTPVTNTLTVTKKFVDDKGAALPLSVLGSYQIDVTYTALNSSTSAREAKSAQLKVAATNYDASTGVATWTVPGVVYNTPVHVHENNYRSITGYDFESTAVTGPTGTTSHVDDANFNMPASASTVAFTNTYKRQVTSIEITKTWNDQKYFESPATGKPNDYARPATLNFTVTGKATGVTDTTKPVTMTSVAGGTSGAYTQSVTVSDLPLYINGKAVTYSVEETVPTGYTSTVTAPLAKNDNGTYEVTIANTPKDAEVYEPTRITLKKTDAKTGNVITKTVESERAVFTVTKPDGTSEDVTIDGTTGTATYTFTAPGDYTIAEKTPPTGYKASTDTYEFTVNKDLTKIEFKNTDSLWQWFYNLISGSSESVWNNTDKILTVANEPEEATLTVAKKWADQNNRDGLRVAEIGFTLYENGQESARTDKAKTMTGVSTTIADGSETGTLSWTLPIYRDGVKVKYSVVETTAGTNLASYTTTYSNAAGGLELDGTNDKIVVTNTYTPKTTTIQVNKVWVDEDSAGRQASTALTLYKTVNGATSATTFTGSVTPESGTNVVTWTVPVNENGYPITYRLEEAAMAGYAATYSTAYTKVDNSSYTASNGEVAAADVKADTTAVITITNTQPVEVEVSKTWVKGANTNVVFQLYRTTAENPAAVSGGSWTPDSTWELVDGATHTFLASDFTVSDTGDTKTYTFTGLPKQAPDGKAYTYRVLETTDGSGRFTANQTGNLAVTNTNTMDAVQANVNVVKELSGRNWTTSDAFWFKLTYDPDHHGTTVTAENPIVYTEVPMPGTNDKGSQAVQPAKADTTAVGAIGHVVAFNPISYTASDVPIGESREYYYVITEVTDNTGTTPVPQKDKGITYDGTIVEGTWTPKVAKAKVTVTNTDGTITTDVSWYNGTEYVQGAVPVFTNTYDASVQVPGYIVKHVHGRNFLEGDSFNFDVINLSGSILRTTKDGAASTTPTPGEAATITSATGTYVTKGAEGYDPTNTAGEYKAIKTSTSTWIKVSDLAQPATGAATGTFIYEFDEDVEGDDKSVAADGNLLFDNRSVYMKVVLTDNMDGTIKVEPSYYYDAACTQAIPDTKVMINKTTGELAPAGSAVTEGGDYAYINAAFFENDAVVDIPVKKIWVDKDGTTPVDPTDIVTVNLRRFAVDPNNPGTLPGDDLNQWEAAGTHTFQLGDYTNGVASFTFENIELYERDAQGRPTGNQYVYRIREATGSDAYKSEYAKMNASGAADGAYAGNWYGIHTDGKQGFIIKNTLVATNQANIAAVKQLMGREWLDSDSFDFKLIPVGKASYDATTGEITGIEETNNIPMPANVTATAAKYADAEKTVQEIVGVGERLARFDAITYNMDQLSYDPSDGHMQGDFYYKMVEVIPGNAVAADGTTKYSDDPTATGPWTYKGITYDGTEHTVHVKVRENRTDTLTVQVAYDYTDYKDISKGTQFTPVFTNTYDSKGKQGAWIEKRIMGRYWDEGDSFTFTVQPLGSAPFFNADGTPVVGDNRDVTLSIAAEAVGTDTAQRIELPALHFQLSDLTWTVGPDGAKDPRGIGTEEYVYLSDGTTKATEGLKYRRFVYAISEKSTTATGLSIDTDTEYIRITVIDKGDGTLDTSYKVYEDRNCTHERDDVARPSQKADAATFVNQLKRNLSVTKNWTKPATADVVLRLEWSLDGSTWNEVGGTAWLAGVDATKTIAKDATGDALTATWTGLPAYANIQDDIYNLNDVWVYYRVVEDAIQDVDTRYSSEAWTEGTDKDDSAYSTDPIATESEKDSLAGNTYTTPRVTQTYVINFPKDVEGTANVHVVKQLIGRGWTGDDSFSFIIEPVSSMIGDETEAVSYGTEDGQRLMPMPIDETSGEESDTATATTSDSESVSINEYNAAFDPITIKLSDLGVKADGTAVGTFTYTVREVIPDGASSYTVTEGEGTDAHDVTYYVYKHVKYTSEVHTVTITAQNTGSGVVATDVSYDGRPVGDFVPVFTNEALVETPIEGSKTWIGGETDEHVNTGLGITVQRRNAAMPDWTDVSTDDAGRTLTVEWSADTGDATYTIYALDGTEQVAPVLDTVGPQGNEYEYRIVEKNVPEGYAESYAGEKLNRKNITNTSLKTDELTVAKSWSDGDDAEGLRPDSVTFHLYKVVNNADVSAGVEPKTLTPSEGTWPTATTATWTGLPVYDAAGNKIVYKVVEESVAGYTTSYAGGLDANPQTIELDGETGAQTITATNSLTPGVTSLTVTKAWNDADDIDNKRPGSVTINLYEYVWTEGQDSASYVKSADPVATITLNGEADDEVAGTTIKTQETAAWEGTFTDLPATKNGKTVIYAVEEDVTDTDVYAAAGTEGKYSNTPCITGNQVDGFTVTNSYTPETVEIKVTKAWANDEATNRPPNVVFTLKADGTAVDEAVLTAPSWEASFTGLPKNKVESGTSTAIVYTVEETAVPGYKADVESATVTFGTGENANKGTATITNTKVAADLTVTLPATKTLNVPAGSTRKLAKEEFSFAIVGGRNTNVTGINAAATAVNTPAAITWNNLTFSVADLFDENGQFQTKRDFKFAIYEKPGTDEDISYDGNVYERTLTLEWDATLNNGAGGLKATWDVTTPIAFKNTYNPDGVSSTPTGPTDATTTAIISVNKAINDVNKQNRALKANEFLFQLELTGTTPAGLPLANSKVLGTNAANGTITFPNIIFEKAGVYTFEMSELAGNTDVTDIATYDGAKYTVTATVTDDGTGQLKVAWSITAKDGTATEGADTSTATFTNITKAATKSVIARATWDGDAYGAPSGTQIERRPSSLPVKLQKQVDGAWVDVDGATATLTKDNNWTYSFADQPVYDEAGSLIKYQVVPTTTPEGYTATPTTPVSNSVVTASVIKLAYGEMSITGTKVWVDGGKTHDNAKEITLLVYAGTGSTQRLLTEGTDYHVDWNGNSYTIRGLVDHGEGYYAVAEKKVEGYTSSENVGGTFTNTIEQVERTVYVEKTWVGDDPEPVTVELYADGIATGKKLELSEGNSWKGNWAGLYTYALGDAIGTATAEQLGNNGHEIVYTVKEAEGATTPYHSSISGSGTEADPFVVSNAFDAIDIPVTKIWDDADDQDGMRPESITVELQTATPRVDEQGEPVLDDETGEQIIDIAPAKDVHGTAIEALTLSEANNWSGLFRNAPRIDANGNAIEYSVKELAVEGYTTTIDGDAAEGFTITNTHSVETTPIEVIKVWDDAEGGSPALHTDVVLHLYGKLNGAVVYDAGAKTIEMGEDGQPKVDPQANPPITGTAIWQNVPQHHFNNADLVWEVVEESVFGYTATIEYSNGVDEQTGETIWAEEQPADWADQDVHQIRVTNTYTGPTATVSVEKDWQDNDNVDGKRPGSVSYELWQSYEQADGTLAAEKVVSLPEGATVWDANGNPLTYAEGKVDVAVVGDRAAADYGAATAVFENLPVVKQIATGETVTEMRYESETKERAVTATLYIDDEETTVYVFELDGVTYYNTAEDGSGAWYGPDYLPVEISDPAAEDYVDMTGAIAVTEQYEEAGEQEVTVDVTKDVAVLYSVKEVELDEALGYDDPVIVSTNPGEFTAINARARDTRDITITKTWSDGNHSEDGMMPDHATFTLLGDGVTPIHGDAVKLEGLTVSKGNNWTLTVHDLPKNKIGENGEPEAILYTVTETDVADGYTPGITWDGDNVAVHNTYNGFYSMTATKVWANENGDTAKRATVTLHLIQVVDGTRRDMGDDYVRTIAVDASKTEQTVEWEDLPKFVGGKAATYTVEEDALAGYSTQIGAASVDDANNTIALTVTNTRDEKVTITYQSTDPKTGETTVIVEERIVPGDKEPGQPADPTLPEDHASDYRFVGWKRTVDEKGNVTYDAQWAEVGDIVVKYTDGQGNIIESTGIKRGDDEPGSPADPTREGYVFGGWRRSYDEATGEVTYEAQWIKLPPTVSYIDPMAPDGKMIVGSKTYADQDAADAEASSMADKPADPTHSGLTFAGWVANKDENGNYVMVATYNEVIRPSGTIVSVIDPLAEDGKRVISSVETDDPSSIELPAGPSHSGMTFKEWALTKDAAGNWIYTPVYAPLCPACPDCCDDCSNGGSKPAPAPTPATPKTGDATSLVPMVALAGAGVSLVAAGVRRRRTGVRR